MSSRRGRRQLQFEPRGWQREFRAILRAAISALRGTGLPLHAQYRSAVREHCDTENILFYNLGTSAFAAATAAGVHFERGYVVPACPVDLCSEPLHYHRYETRSDTNGLFHLWRETSQLARFDCLLPRLSADTKPATVWLAMHQASGLVPASAVWRGEFALQLKLRVPEIHASPVTVVKPLLDGVIAAFCAYEGTRLMIAAERVAAQLGLDAQRAAELLTDQSRALLGYYELVVPRATSVQWQPPDDRCMACDLRLEIGTPAGKLDGELLAVTE